MQIAIVAREGGNELADKIYRAVVSEEISRMQAKHARQIDDLTEAHKMTAERLSAAYKADLARMDKRLAHTRWQRITQPVAILWAKAWGLCMALGLIVEDK